MADARWARLALEVGFLLAVAAILAAADVEPVWIAVIMLIAWVIVALLEWAAWHGEAHWASGRPPRYYVPPQPQPPRPPTRELPPFTRYPRASTPPRPPRPPRPPTRELPPFTRYPRAEPRESEAPTWIAPPELREEVLGWPAHAYEPEAQTSLQESTVEEPPPALDDAVAVGEPVVEEVAPEPEPIAAPAPLAPEPRPGVAKPSAFAWWPEPDPRVESAPVEGPVDDGVVVAEAAEEWVPVEPELEELLEAVVEPDVEPAVPEEEPVAEGGSDDSQPGEVCFVDEATVGEPPTGDLAVAIAEHDRNHDG